MTTATTTEGTAPAVPNYRGANRLEHKRIMSCEQMLDAAADLEYLVQAAINAQALDTGESAQALAKSIAMRAFDLYAAATTHVAYCRIEGDLMSGVTS